MKICGIYRIKNLIDGKVYIGQSIDIERRRRNHFVSLRSGDHKNVFLQRAYKKYGEENFNLCIMEETCQDMLDVRECAWIKYYKSDQSVSGYNLETGGNLNHHHTKGRIVSNETRQKLALANTGKHHSKETRIKLSLARRKRVTSQETRLKMSKSLSGKKHYNYGKHLSEECKRKISESQRGEKSHKFGKHISEETRHKMSEAQKGRRPSPQTIIAAIKARTGVHHSVETRQRMSEAHKGIKNHNYGKCMSEETKRKISESKRNRKH